MTTRLRNADFRASESEVLSRIAEARSALALRREHLSEWQRVQNATYERNEIDYIDSMLAWFEFGGPVPFWIASERDRQPGERMLEL